MISTAFYIGKSEKKEISKRIVEFGKAIKKLDDEEKRLIVNWASKVMSKKREEEKILREKMWKGEDEDMLGLAEWADEMWNKEKEGELRGEKRGRSISIKSILIKKLKEDPTSKIEDLLSDISESKLDILEDKIFEIESWKEVEELLK